MSVEGAMNLGKSLTATGTIEFYACHADGDGWALKTDAGRPYFACAMGIPLTSGGAIKLQGDLLQQADGNMSFALCTARQGRNGCRLFFVVVLALCGDLLCFGKVQWQLAVLKLPAPWSSRSAMRTIQVVGPGLHAGSRWLCLSAFSGHKVVQLSLRLTSIRKPAVQTLSHAPLEPEAGRPKAEFTIAGSSCHLCQALWQSAVIFFVTACAALDLAMQNKAAEIKGSCHLVQ